MSGKNPSHLGPASTPTNAHGVQIAIIQVDPPDYNSPPAYGASGDNAGPPTYESLYGKLKVAKNNSDGNMEFAKKGYGVVCASLCPLIITLLIWCTAVASLIMGDMHLNDCPVEKMIPVYLMVYGTMFTVKALISSARYAVNHDKTPDEESKAWNLERLLDCFLIVWFILGSVYVYRTHNKYQSVDPSLPDYCHGPLYKFAFWTITINYIWMLLLFFMGCCCVGFMCCCVRSKESKSDSD